MVKDKANPSLPFHSDIIRVGIERKLKTREVLFLHTIRAGMHSRNHKNWRSQKTLAKEMRCTRTIVNQVVNDLEQKGLIKVKRTEGKPCIYQLILPKTCKESKQGCKESEPVPVKNLNRGGKESKQGGIKNLNTNISSNNRSKEYTNSKLSLSIPLNDEDKRSNNNSNSDCQKEIETETDNGTSDKMQLDSFVAERGKKKSDRIAEKLKAVNGFLVEAEGERFAKCASYFADGIIERKKIDHGPPYKIKVLQSILDGQRPDFVMETVEEQMWEEEERKKRVKEWEIAFENDRKEKEKEQEKRKAEETQKGIEKERVRKLKRLYSMISKDDHIVYDAMFQIGLVSEKGKLYVKDFTEFLKECKAHGKISGQETLQKDVRRAILERAGF